MALSRCLENDEHAWPNGHGGNVYVVHVLPIGYPTTSTICGRDGCQNPGVVWLNQAEADAYNNENQRIFQFTGEINHTKVKVQ